MAADVEATKIARSQISRRSIDTSYLTIRVTHGVCYLTGVIKTLRAHPEVELQKEMEIISTILRGKPGIREVVWETTLRT